MLIHVNNKVIGEGNPVFFIAEAGVNHNGSMKLAKQLIDVAADAGADAVKFQSFKTENIIIPSAPKSTYHIQTTGSDKAQTWFELLKSQELSREMHIELINYCKQVNIIFLSTPYDRESVDLLDELNVPMFKVASTDTNNIPLLKYIASKRRPTILSSAMATMEEVINAVECLRNEGLEEIAMLQCTGNYPTRLEDSNLNVIDTYFKQLNCVIGYSDHTEDLINPIAATAKGVSIYEKHFTLDKSLPGPDHRMALNPDELRETIKAIRDTEIALGKKEKIVLKTEEENRLKLRKSLVAATDIQKNSIITYEMIGIKRPGNGMEPKLIYSIIGKKAVKDITADELITPESFN